MTAHVSAARLSSTWMKVQQDSKTYFHDTASGASTVRECGSCRACEASVLVRDELLRLVLSVDPVDPGDRGTTGEAGIFSLGRVGAAGAGC